MRILGIDPGLASTGVGVIERRDETWHLLAVRDVRTAPREPFPRRLQRIHDLVADCIGEFAPDAVAIESIFTAKNVRSAILMAHGRGVAVLAASSANIPVFEYTPAEIKSAIVGKGRASKSQVMHMIRVLLSLRAPVANDHQADALACALAHAFRTRLGEQLNPGDAATSETLSEAKLLLAQVRRGRRRR
ncbi:MAG: crossover junction endodeoxyribonuclease RuvC [Candidatus Sumerlaeia bacterium]|nr:crossover junction endodeoxyribonuclease RuvC [Candidatus Sumerlaeia bacterium]